MNMIVFAKNKVFFYLVSRYFTYFLQFVTSLIIAIKLGPYYLGIWGFVSLIINYFQQIHFGVPNSFNVLYVQHRDNEQEKRNYIGNSIILVTYLIVFVVLFLLFYLFWGIGSIEKYHAENYLIWICVIAILQYYVLLFISVFRVKNQLNRVTFCQSIIVLLCFCSVLVFEGEKLITALVASYVVGNLSCIILALASKTIPSINKTQIRFSYQKEIVDKGLFLFLYSSCFYFIIIFLRTLISTNYSVEEFGLFTFSYSLAHAMLLILEAVTFVVFPKVIGLLSSDDIGIVDRTLKMLRMSYLTLAHLLIYIALLLFPLFIYFVPKYSDIVTSFNLIALTILISKNAYGYLELLISKNREKKLSFLSALALLLNGILALFFVKVLKMSYSYIILATLLSYFFFTISSIVCGLKMQGTFSIRLLFKETLPIRLFIPFVAALLISILEVEEMIFIPLLLFLVFNWKVRGDIHHIVKSLLLQPEKINL